MVVSFLGCDRLWTLVLLTTSVGLMGAVYAGFLLNHLDLAPGNLSGTVYGLISALATVSSWLAPLTVAALTEGQQTLERWRIAFLLCAGILILANGIFVLFGSTERQEWDKSPMVIRNKADNKAEEYPTLEMA